MRRICVLVLVAVLLVPALASASHDDRVVVKSTKFYVGGGLGLLEPICGRTVGVGGACFNISQATGIDRIWVNDVNIYPVRGYLTYFNAAGNKVGGPWVFCDHAGGGGIPPGAAVMKVSVSERDVFFNTCKEVGRFGTIEVTYEML